MEAEPRTDLDRMVAWYRAQLDADEQDAREILALVDSGAEDVRYYNPSEVLDQVAAHRAILDELLAMPHTWEWAFHRECPMIEPALWGNPRCTCGRDGFVERMIRHAVSGYAGRDGFDEAWRPA